MKRNIILRGQQNKFRFNPFSKENFLGEGGMSNVYKGEELNSGTPVAIKVLLQEYSQDPMYIERARRESTIRFDHPNVIKMIDFIKQNNKYHLVAEYLDGETIEDRLERYKSSLNYFSAEESFAIIEDVLEGLKALHSQYEPIIHRDIKPGNIMLCTNGRAKIMDFGISKIERAEIDRKLTGIGIRMGTPAYLAPEQVKRENELIDHRTDFYSVGITWYEMLTGMTPFDSSNEYEQERQIREAPLPAHPNIPAPVFKIMQKATEKDRANRFQNANEFIEALKQLEQDDSPPEPRKGIPSWAYVSIGISVLIFIFFIALIILNYN